MSDDLRIKEVNSLLERYYNSEDPFEQTDLAISIINGHAGYLLNSLKKNIRYREAIEKANDIAKNHNIMSAACSDINFILDKALEEPE